MARKPALWDEIKEIVGKASRPPVEVPVSARVTYRIPRVTAKNENRRLAAVHVPGGTRMRCRNPGCYRVIRCHQLDIVCSERCRRDLRRYCHMTLAVLEGRMDARDYPVEYRTCRRATKQIREQASKKQASMAARYRFMKEVFMSDPKLKQMMAEALPFKDFDARKAWGETYAKRGRPPNHLRLVKGAAA